MPTLKIHVSDVIKVIDTVPQVVKFVVRVVKQFFRGVIKALSSIIVEASRGRAPPVVRKYTKDKGGSRS